MLQLPAKAARVILYCGALSLHPSHFRAIRAFDFRPPVYTTIDQHRKSETQIKHDPRRWRRRPTDAGYLCEAKSVLRQLGLGASQENAPPDTHPPSSIVPLAPVASGSSEQDERPEKRAGRSPSKTSRGSAPPAPQGPETPVDAPSPPLEVLHLDEDFAAICKPPLMHVHRPEFGTKDKEFVMQKARNQLGRRIFLPHRLDRGTSGCLLLGFGPEAVKVLHQALADPRSSKTYVAIVRGSGQGFVGKGWFTVDRAIKDDKKILREASTRFLFVKGGDDPDPRCCLVLAQPSTGRFHQIRRHLNGLSHPIVGDSVHGNSRFNREVAAHRNPAPAGRLMLHCLRLSLATLPGAGSSVWKSAAGGELSSSGAAAVTAEGVYRESGIKFEHPPLVRGEGGEENRTRGSGGGSEEAGPSQEEGKAARVDTRGAAAAGSARKGVQTPAEPRKALSEASRATSGLELARAFPAEPLLDVRGETSGGEVLPSTIQGAAAAGSSGPIDVGAGSEEGVLKGKGFRVYSEPPDDMMKFLRGMSWWEEGMIQAAERSGRQGSSVPPVL